MLQVLYQRLPSTNARDIVVFSDLLCTNQPQWHRDRSKVLAAVQLQHALSPAIRPLVKYRAQDLMASYKLELAPVFSGLKTVARELEDHYERLQALPAIPWSNE